MKISHDDKTNELHVLCSEEELHRIKVERGRLPNDGITSAEEQIYRIKHAIESYRREEVKVIFHVERPEGNEHTDRSNQWLQNLLTAVAGMEMFNQHPAPGLGQEDKNGLRIPDHALFCAEGAKLEIYYDDRDRCTVVRVRKR